MKELSIEEKAKRYDEALAIAKEIYNGNPSSRTAKVVCNQIFPELKEVEDENIRKWIRKELESKYVVDNIVNNVMADKALAWLTKQDEQNHTDNVEPKFKAGDWIVIDSEVLHFKNVTENGYLTDKSGLIPFRNEKDAHLWTIQDAKDGDVLAFDNDNIVIFKDLYNYTSFHSYCHIEDGIFGFSTDGLPDWWEDEGFKPATKEQRDLLFQKMKEAGYVWDEKKKELKENNYG